MSTKKTAKSPAYRDYIESLYCPKCKQLLAGEEPVRLRSRPSLTTQMQKLLKKQRSERSLTARQLELLQRAMQRCNVLVLKCSPCQWQTWVKLQTRELLHRHKARLRHKAAERMEPCEGDVEEPTDKMAQQKLRKKDRRKKVADARTQEFMHFKRLSSTPTNGAKERCAETPTSSTPLRPSSSASQRSPQSAESVSVAGEPEMLVTPIPPSRPSTEVRSDRGTPQFEFLTPIPFPAVKTNAKSAKQTPQSDRRTETLQSDRQTLQLDSRTPQSNRRTLQLDSRTLELNSQTPQSNRRTLELNSQTPQSDRRTLELNSQTPQSNRRTLQLDRRTPQSDRRTPQLDRRTPQSDRTGGGGGRRGGQTPGKQQLKKVLQHQQKKTLSASESLAQFMNSMK